jgi:hypothetical protein
MKKFFAIFIFITSFCFADVTATITGVRLGDQHYVWIDIQYNIDGRVILNAYPFDMKNYAGKTNAEFFQWIKTNVEYQCDRYIEAEFRKKKNQSEIITKLNTLLLNKSMTKQNAELTFDKNNDGIDDLKWTIKTDGTYVETAVS